jgi:hypothetical protein
MKTLINERQREDNKISLSKIQSYAPIKETEKSHSKISNESIFGYHKKLID